MDHNRPLHFSSDLYAAASPAIIWDYFADVARWPEWSPVCERCRIVDGVGLAEGGVLEMRLRIAGLAVAARVTIIECRPPESITWRSKRGRVAITHGYRFVHDGAGTRMFNDERLDGLDPYRRLLVAGWFRWTDLSGASLAGIKRNVEQMRAACP